MIIHVVQPGETLTSIASQYGVSPQSLITDNELPNPENLLIGQSIIVLYPEVTHTIIEGDTLFQIAQQYGVEPTQILQNNPWLADQEGLIPGQTLVILFQRDEVLGNILVNGYAYTFINRTTLRKTLPYLTYLSIFTYGFTPEGELIPVDDEELIQLALDYGVAPLMVLAPMDAQGAFSNEIAHQMFTNPGAQDRLVSNLLAAIQEKGYRGLDIDFEFVLPEDKELFIEFISRAQAALGPEGYIVTVALAPKTSAGQVGLLYQAHDYPVIGEIADLVLLMTYEWGYTFGPPMATAPLNSVRRVLEYGISEIDPDKILMGIPNYAYDWVLPFIRGETQAESLSNVAALERGIEHGVTIQFDEDSQTPFYYYTSPDINEHVVWFEDARSMNAKYRLIPEYNLRGSGVWQIMNFFPQSWVVVTQLFNIEKV